MPCAVFDKTGETLPLDVARSASNISTSIGPTGEAISRLARRARGARRGPRCDRRPAVAITLPERPYPGLRPFETDEWVIFFGRERMIDEVIGRLAESRLVLIHGVSGSGKSSLVRAGVLPKLALQYSRHDAPWLTCDMRPSGGPLWNVATEFARLEGRGEDLERVSEIAGIFNARGATLASVAASHQGGRGQEPLPACRPVRGVVPLREGDEPRRGGVVRRSHSSAPQPKRRRIRAGRGRPPRDRHHALGISWRMRPLRRFRRDDQPHPISRAAHGRRGLMRAVRRPAQMYGAEFDEGLAERLIASVRGREDELPLLQHGLMLMWEDAAARSAPGERVDGSTARSWTRRAASPSFCPAMPTG